MSARAPHRYCVRMHRYPCRLLPVVAALTLPVLVMAGRSRAQQESAAAVMREEEKSEPAASTSVFVSGQGRVSPMWTQTRTFAATRFWRLDPGEQEFEVWYSARVKRDGGSHDPNVDSITTHLWQLEYMVSLIRGVQLDVYANYAYDKENGPHIEGAQIETRIAPWAYGAIFANPVLYLEWHPQTRDANRGEVRVLLGGEIVPRFRAAMNLLMEQKLDSATGRKADFRSDREIGATGALAFEVVPRHFALGAEGRVLFDQQGGDDYQKVAKIGPAFWFVMADRHIRITATALIGLNDRSDAFNPIAIFAYRP